MTSVGTLATVALLVALVLAVGAVAGACAGGNGTGTTAGPLTTGGSTSTTGAVTGEGDWLTYDHDAARSGLSGDQEPLGQVQQAWTASLDGQALYAQPLVAGDLVVAATEGNSVFALNVADGAVVWQVNLGTPVRGSDLPCGNIDPSGITGTPVIDAQSGTIFVVAFLRDGPHHQLFALDLKTGATRWSRAIDPPGLSPVVEQQRGALTLANGMVYVPYGGLAGDCGQYKGAVVAVPTDGTGTALSYIVPTTRMGGIWNPTGVVADSAGDIWLATGNTASQSTYDYGDAVIHLSAQLQVLDYFAPTDWAALNARDLDISTTAPVLLPGERVLIAGKMKTVFLLDANDLGHVGTALATAQVDSRPFGTAVAIGTRAFIPCEGLLVAVDAAGDQLSIAWSTSLGVGSPIVAAQYVWALGHDGRLRAYAPADGQVVYELRLSGPVSQFITLSAAGGRLFVADKTRLVALNLR